MAGAQATSIHGLRTPGKGVRPSRSSASPLSLAVDRSVTCLLSRQAADGHWVGELQGDTILESEYIMLMAFLGRENDGRVECAARYILEQQQVHGAWSSYPDGPPDISVSVKAYFALKIAGYDADEPPLRQARAVIRSLGGAAACNSFSKFYLALLGQFPYANCPAVPPEMLLLPRWAYFNLYAVSSWSRTILVPLSLFYAHKPVRTLPPQRGISELFLQPPHTPLWPHPPTRRWLTWTNFFLVLDQAIKSVEKIGLGPLRAAAVRRAENWMLQHLTDSDGLGAIFPPMVYTVICLRCLGHGEDSPELQWALEQLEKLILAEEDTIRLQPCFSPVWDTALTLNALADAGVTPEHQAVVRGAQWLLEREVRRPGDWSVANPGLEPAGWFFEYRNGFYPDMDDTSMVLMALAKTGQAAKPEARPAVERALRWLLGMQNRDGGWAAFDRDINREVLTRVPFADHNAMLDPSCPDITARVLEALGHYGFGTEHPQVQRALAYIEAAQTAAGCWPGRWGVNYLYGTWQVLTGLASVGFHPGHPLVQRAVAWLKEVQQAGGGWGESCRSYDDPSYAGQGTPTASQTSWALMGLIAAGEADSDAVRGGIAYLLATQKSDGGWTEEHFTGTGFPRVFYLKYHMYSLYFPLMALARFAQAIHAKSVAREPSIHLFKDEG